MTFNDYKSIDEYSAAELEALRDTTIRASESVWNTAIGLARSSETVRTLHARRHALWEPKASVLILPPEEVEGFRFSNVVLFDEDNFRQPGEAPDDRESAPALAKLERAQAPEGDEIMNSIRNSGHDRETAITHLRNAIGLQLTTEDFDALKSMSATEIQACASNHLRPSAYATERELRAASQSA